jgi:hypothetical protein
MKDKPPFAPCPDCGANAHPYVVCIRCGLDESNATDAAWNLTEDAYSDAGAELLHMERYQ